MAVHAAVARCRCAALPLRGRGLGLAGELGGVGEREADVRDEVGLGCPLGETEGALEELPGRGEVLTGVGPTGVEGGLTGVGLTQVGLTGVEGGLTGVGLTQVGLTGVEGGLTGVGLTQVGLTGVEGGLTGVGLTQVGLTGVEGGLTGVGLTGVQGGLTGVGPTRVEPALTQVGLPQLAPCLTQVAAPLAAVPVEQRQPPLQQRRPRPQVGRLPHRPVLARPRQRRPRVAQRPPRKVRPAQLQLLLHHLALRALRLEPPPRPLEAARRLLGVAGRERAVPEHRRRGRREERRPPPRRLRLHPRRHAPGPLERPHVRPELRQIEIEHQHQVRLPQRRGEPRPALVRGERLPQLARLVARRTHVEAAARHQIPEPVLLRRRERLPVADERRLDLPRAERVDRLVRQRAHQRPRRPPVPVQPGRQPQVQPREPPLPEVARRHPHVLVQARQHLRLVAPRKRRLRARPRLRVRPEPQERPAREIGEARALPRRERRRLPTGLLRLLEPRERRRRIAQLEQARAEPHERRPPPRPERRRLPLREQLLQHLARPPRAPAPLERRRDLEPRLRRRGRLEQRLGRRGPRPRVRLALGAPRQEQALGRRRVARQRQVQRLLLDPRRERRRRPRVRRADRLAAERRQERRDRPRPRQRPAPRRAGRDAAGGELGEVRDRQPERRQRLVRRRAAQHGQRRHRVAQRPPEPPQPQRVARARPRRRRVEPREVPALGEPPRGHHQIRGPPGARAQHRLGRVAQPDGVHPALHRLAPERRQRDLAGAPPRLGGHGGERRPAPAVRDALRREEQHRIVGAQQPHQRLEHLPVRPAHLVGVVEHQHQRLRPRARPRARQSLVRAQRAERARRERLLPGRAAEHRSDRAHPRPGPREPLHGLHPELRAPLRLAQEAALPAAGLPGDHAQPRPALPALQRGERLGDRAELRVAADQVGRLRRRRGQRARRRAHPVEHLARVGRAVARLGPHEALGERGDRLRRRLREQRRDRAQGAAEREQVRAPVGRLAADHLGRHVALRAGDPVVGPLADPRRARQIDQHRAPRRVDEDVGRLHVAVPDARPVEEAQRVEHVDDRGPHLLEPPACHVRVERRAEHRLRREVEARLAGLPEHAEVVHPDEVRVEQARQHPELAAERRPLRAARAAEQLQTDVAPERLVAREPRRGQPPPAQRADQAVAAGDQGPFGWDHPHSVSRMCHLRQ
nr:hypothetical protein [Sorangium cellulosum]